jgi:hypothetical protein
MGLHGAMVDPWLKFNCGFYLSGQYTSHRLEQRSCIIGYSMRRGVPSTVLLEYLSREFALEERP